MWNLFKKKEPPTPVVIRTPVLLTKYERELLVTLVGRQIATAKLRGTEKQVNYLTALRAKLQNETL